MTGTVLPSCDRCDHLASIHTRRTKYTDHACNQRDKNVTQVFEDTKEGVVHELAKSLRVCICDGLVMKAQHDPGFAREQQQFLDEAKVQAERDHPS